jgi:hypothetical protein
MNNNNQKKYIIIKESLIESVLMDIFTFGGILLIIGINHYKLDDSFFGGFWMSFILLTWILAKTRGKMIKVSGKKGLINFIIKTYGKI